MNHKLYMTRCLQLAANAKGNTHPNPLVGAVVVHDGQIIGEGWHHRAGQPHAEVHAIQSVKNQQLLKDSTLYVSLEPCAHFGKTPPCANLIIEKNIPRVVIGCRDPFDAVNGKGIEKLKNAGVQVTVGVLEDQCLQLNAPFFTYHTKGRPYILLKWAQTADGYMDIHRASDSKGVYWITAPSTKILVHQWRHQADAIAVGANTVLNDNPELTVRKVHGINPLRIVLDPDDLLPAGFKVLDGQVATYILTRTPGKTDHANLHYIDITNYENAIAAMLHLCKQKNIQSLLVEGGAYTLRQLIDSGNWDEARVLTGAAYLGQGLKAPALPVPPIETHTFGNDTINVYSP